VDEERFEQLKLRAEKVLSDLRHLTRSGATIHRENRLYVKIANRLFILGEMGEYTCKGKYTTANVTLDALSKNLDEAEDFIVEVKRGPREV